MSRYRFYGGKGGVGKTTCAAAAALAAADAGRRILVVSTDPAHSLGDALQHRLTARPTTLPGRHGALHAVELDADRALGRWLGRRRRTLRTIAERGTYLDEEDVERFLQLSLPGVDELIGLLELTRLARSRPGDAVIVDTAPTGHTLRLLEMPATLRRIAAVFAEMHAKHRFLAESLAGRYQPDEGDALIDEIDAEGRALRALLTDPDRCTFTWVLRPEGMALEEARDAVTALEASGIVVSEIVINGVTPPPPRPCQACAGKIAAERQTLAAIATAFPGRTLRVVPALDTEPRGRRALRIVAQELLAPGMSSRGRQVAARPTRARAAPTTITTTPPWLP
ncbi:MAG: ArsA family ATPase, partial [Candidatus Rokuibacteriota bacterium]